VYLRELSWVMVRASGSANLLRVFSEPSMPETTRRILTAVGEIVQNL